MSPNAAARSAASTLPAATRRSRSSTPPPAVMARDSSPMAAVSSASPPWAGTLPKPTTARTPRSTRSAGPKAFAAATSAAARSGASRPGREGSAAGEGDFDAAERAELGGDAGAVAGEDHAGPRAGSDKGASFDAAALPHQISEIEECRDRVARGADAAVREGLAVLGNPHLGARQIERFTARHRGAPDEPAIRIIVGEDRRPPARLKIGVARIDDFDDRMERRTRRDLGAVIGRRARRQIT